MGNWQDPVSPMKTKVRKMKKIKWITAGVILLVAGVACWNYIVKNERDKEYPVERYMEQEEEKQQDNKKRIQRNFLEDRLDDITLSKLENIRRKH